MDRPLSGSGYVLVLGSNATKSLLDVHNPANTERFCGLAPLLPYLCPLSARMGGGIFRKPPKRAIWNTQVCMLY